MLSRAVLVAAVLATAEAFAPICPAPVSATARLRAPWVAAAASGAVFVSVHDQRLAFCMGAAAKGAVVGRSEVQCCSDGCRQLPAAESVYQLQVLTADGCATLRVPQQGALVSPVSRWLTTSTPRVPRRCVKDFMPPSSFLPLMLHRGSQDSRVFGHTRLFSGGTASRAGTSKSRLSRKCSAAPEHALSQQQ